MCVFGCVFSMSVNYCILMGGCWVVLVNFIVMV